MWMGGNIPLGYDVEERNLIVNAGEADQVRMIYDRYLELGSVPKLARQLAEEGVRSKRWTSRRGTCRGGMPLSCGALYHILNNRVYRGEIVHKGTAHKGEHPAIISNTLFEQVQSHLCANRQKRKSRRTRAASCPLTGKIYDQDGKPMRPTFGYGRGSKIYRYYVSDVLLPGGRIGSKDPQGIRLSAERIERLILDRLKLLVPQGQPAEALFDAIARVSLSSERMALSLHIDNLIQEGECEDMLLGRAQRIDAEASIEGEQLSLVLDARPARRGKAVRISQHQLDDAERRRTLADLVHSAHRKLHELNASPLEPELHRTMTAPVNAWTRERIVIGFLAPDIQKALLQGTAPPDLDPERLLSRDMPLDWDEQRRFLGIRH